MVIPIERSDRQCTETDVTGGKAALREKRSQTKLIQNLGGEP